MHATQSYAKLLVTRVSDITPLSCVIEGMQETSSKTIRLPFNVFDGRRFRMPRLHEIIMAKISLLKNRGAYEAIVWHYETE